MKSSLMENKQVVPEATSKQCLCCLVHLGMSCDTGWHPGSAAGPGCSAWWQCSERNVLRKSEYISTTESIPEALHFIFNLRYQVGIVCMLNCDTNRKQLMKPFVKVCLK